MASWLGCAPVGSAPKSVTRNVAPPATPASAAAARAQMMRRTHRMGFSFVCIFSFICILPFLFTLCS